MSRHFMLKRSIYSLYFSSKRDSLFFIICFLFLLSIFFLHFPVEAADAEKENCVNRGIIMKENDILRKIVDLVSIKSGYLHKSDVEKYFETCLEESIGITPIDLNDESGHIYRPINLQGQPFGFEFYLSNDKLKSFMTILFDGAGFCIDENKMTRELENSGWVRKGRSRTVFEIYRYSREDGKIQMSFNGGCLKSMAISSFDSNI
jgi:hypothetical protein